LIDGGTILVDKKEHIFTFGSLLCGLDLLGAAWESGIHVFSIDQINESKEDKSPKGPINLS
jgi:hypothetical protein